MKLSACPVVGLILLATLVEASAAYNVLDHWSKRAPNSVNRVRFVNGQFIALGNSGLIMTSSNGANWAIQNSGTSAALKGVAYGWGEYVVVGQSVMLRSSNAQNWTNLVLTNGSFYLKDIAFGGNRFVAVEGELGYTPGYASILVSPIFPILSETDGWRTIRLTNGCPGSGYALGFYSVTYAGSRWIVVGDICHEIRVSSNGGTSWSWVQDSTPGDYQFRQYWLGVAYGNGLAVAVGMEGTPHVSTSPFTAWTNASFGNPNFGGDDITFGDGRFVSVGGVTGTWETSSGASWVSHDDTNTASSVAFGAGCFIKAGGGFHNTGPGIYQSDNIAGMLAARRTSASGPVELSLTVEPQRTFGIQATTNFIQWAEIFRGTNTSGGTPQFLDWSVTNGVSRYYRTVTP